MTTTFSEFRDTFDPNDQRDYTFPVFSLHAGESIASAAVVVVDADSLAPIVGTDLVILSTTFALVAGTTWGVTVWITGPLASSAYYLRCSVVTDSAPIARKFDRTMKLNVRQR